MKTAVKISCLFLFCMAGISLEGKENPNKYLKKVLENLERIESAKYYEQREHWNPGDTIAESVFYRFVKEYNNPADSTIGASFVVLSCDEPMQLDFGYDGHIRATTYHEDKEIVVDDFTARPLPIRPLSPPFFNYTKNIINYALTTQDKIATELKDQGDHYFFKLIINEDTQVEFFGKAYHMPETTLYRDPTSIYEIWISKSNDLPYKVRREMDHDISVSTCSDAEYNQISIKDFNVYDYFPKGYEIKQYQNGSTRNTTSVLVGKKAPGWILNDIQEQPVSLDDIKSKVILINFTGLGCGACQAAVPFLKELKNEFSTEKFDLIAIDSWNSKPYSLQNYVNRKELNYRMLSATKKVIEEYKTGGAAPVFFILDQQRIIRKVIRGYNAETTGKEIREAILELL